MGTKNKLPKEDAVLIAPCTFNTLNAISSGQADSYPLCLIASAIGKRVPVFIAPAMNKSLWDHFIIQENIKKLESWGCHIIWPEILKKKTTMICLGKILDTIYFNFNRINFNSKKVSDYENEYRLKKYRTQFIDYFREIGAFLKEYNLNLLTAGCMSVRVKEGFLISSSGSDLSRNFKKENISLIINWDRDRNLCICFNSGFD